MENHLSKAEEKSKLEEKPVISMRWLLVALCATLYFLSFMVKNSFAVAIVSMVNSTSTDNSSNYVDVCPRASEMNSSSSESSNEDGEFLWTTKQQGQILGAYVLGMFLGRILGGRVGELFGQRLVVALGIGLAGVLQLLAPVAANLGPYAMFSLRLLTGGLHGPAYNAIISLLSRWAPRQRLSSMLNTSFTGAPIGSMIGIVTAGLIADSWGWRWIFWSEGIMTVIFIPFWIFFVRNNPKDHPYVTPYEHKILDENSNVVVKKDVPWLKILTSPYLYVLILGQFSRSWIDALQNAEGPTFFNKKIGITLTDASLVTGVASVLGLPALLIYGTLSDFLIRRKYLSRLKTRKLMHVIGTGIPFLICLGISFADCNLPLVITFWMLFGAVTSAQASSINASLIDIGPNYAGTMMGLLGIGNLGGAISPMVASSLADTENGWNKTFFIAAAISLTNCIVYLFIMTDQPQSWNYYEGKKKKKNSPETGVPSVTTTNGVPSVTTMNGVPSVATVQVNDDFGSSNHYSYDQYVTHL